MYIVHVSGKKGSSAGGSDVWWSYDVNGSEQILTEVRGKTPHIENNILLNKASKGITKHTPNRIQPFIKVKSEFDEETIHYAFTYKGIPNELRLRYEKELDETEENKENGLRNLKQIIELQNLETINDNMLLTILRSTKFDPKKSALKLKNFITLRRKISRKLFDMDSKLVTTFLEDTPIGFLPYRDEHGRAIIYIRPYGLHFDKYSMEDFAVILLTLVLFALSFELSAVAGSIYLADCNVPSLDLVIPLTNTFRNCSASLLSLPQRIGKVDIFNDFRLIRWAVKCLQPIIPEKINKRINFIGPYENLTKSYPTEILPDEFGGSLGPLSNEFFKKPFLDFAEQLREEGKSVIKESKRQSIINLFF